jgi:hypothetical protein
MECKHGRENKSSCWECAFEKEVKKLPKFMRDMGSTERYLLPFWNAAQSVARKAK